MQRVRYTLARLKRLGLYFKLQTPGNIPPPCDSAFVFYFGHKEEVCWTASKTLLNHR